MVLGVSRNVNYFGSGFPERKSFAGNNTNVKSRNTRRVSLIADDFGSVQLFKLKVSVCVVKMMVGVEDVFRGEFQFV